MEDDARHALDDAADLALLRRKFDAEDGSFLL